jgi:septum site-determining protein MinC
LHLLEANLNALDEQLTKLKHQAPKFFNSVPVIVDLQRLPADAMQQDFNFEQFKNILNQHQLIIVGLRHLPDSCQAHAKNAGFAILPNATQGKSGGHSAELPQAKPLSTQPKSAAKQAVVEEVPVVAEATASANSSDSHAVVINRSVRSGQQIYAKGTDLIIMGSVSPGAEIIADGNIHVYGQLKGRALAGVSGYKEARIFCKQIAAELVSIAGHYWLYEDIVARAKGLGPIIQIQLEKDQLNLTQI